MRGKPFPPGQSGNPNGRKPGTTLGGKLRAAVGQDFDAIVRAVIAAAKAGDMTAASLLLARTCPAVRPVQEPVPVALDGATLTEKAGSILDAVAQGRLSVLDAKALLEALAAVARIAEVDELTRRIEALEQASDHQTTDPS